MEKASMNFLEQLLAIPSPSGFEEEAVRAWSKYAGKYADKVEKDVHGNAMAVLNEKGGPKVMLAGHIDEIGFMITYINDDGFLYFGQVGGHDRQIIQGMRVRIYTAKGPVFGLLGKKPVHLMRGDDSKKVPDMEDLWIDIGARNGKEAKKLIAIGDPLILDMEFMKMRNGFAVARGFDDRIGAFVAVEAMRILADSRPKPVAAVYAVATVQEEIGLRGAITSTFHIDPQVGVAIDVTHATDYPGASGCKSRVGDIKLGKGPVITRGPNINPKVYDRLVGAAKKKKIAVQIEAATGGTGTDANVMQVSKSGVATGLVSIPNRYMHTPCEMVSLDDVENAAKLLAAFIQDIGPRAGFIPSE
jgi:endoglucanase